MEEYWVPILGFEGLYKISNEGRIKRPRRTVRNNRYKNATTCLPEAYLKCRPIGKNREYKCVLVRLRKDGKTKDYIVSRLMLKSFVGLPKTNQVAMHINGDPTDNRLTNLRWGTVAENNLDTIRMGRAWCLSGSNCPWSKLDEEKVREIKQQYVKGAKGFGLNSLAKKYGVSGTMIENIVKGIWWKHVVV